jgi:hypothetical protein
MQRQDLSLISVADVVAASTVSDPSSDDLAVPSDIAIGDTQKRAGTL